MFMFHVFAQCIWKCYTADVLKVELTIIPADINYKFYLQVAELTRPTCSPVHQTQSKIRIKLLSLNLCLSKRGMYNHGFPPSFELFLNTIRSWSLWCFMVRATTLTSFPCCLVRCSTSSTSSTGFVWSLFLVVNNCRRRTVPSGKKVGVEDWTTDKKKSWKLLKRSSWISHY